jgi:hypothetical protein
LAAAVAAAELAVVTPLYILLAAQAAVELSLMEYSPPLPSTQP